MAREKSPKTEVSIGATDGFRYIAVQPPLTDQEKTFLQKRGLLGGVSYTEDIPGKNACTQFQTMNEVVPPSRVIARGHEIADALRDMRRGVVIFDAKPKILDGAGSTPFGK